MENPSERGLSLTLSWHSGSKKRIAGGPVGPVIRVAAVLALCALSYQFGVWRARLEQQAAVVITAPRELPAAVVAAINKDRGSGASALGGPVGEKEQDIITPLNVRDPSALVMGPGGTR